VDSRHIMSNAVGSGFKLTTGGKRKMSVETKRDLVIIGAGPAGLTAAYEMARHGKVSVVLEADSQVGGISRTVNRDGWRFDIGGHRFFTKVDRVEKFWHEILSENDFLLRPRISRIFYNGKFYDYPLRGMNALRNLGMWEAIMCVGSYGLVRIKPPKDVSNFEGWVAARFGWRLYRTFFKTYTEKVWGVPATQIQADWAAQRIKNLSLGKAVIHALLPKGRNSTAVTSLIEQFQYPKYGPGMMWEVCAEKVITQGSEIVMNTAAEKIVRGIDGLMEVEGSDGKRYIGRQIISTMPINTLVEILHPQAPTTVLQAAQQLKHRDFLTVALVVPEKFSFPDNWIYIHDPNARVGRVQNYGSWSPYLVKDGLTCLGLEYFVFEGDELWSSTDEDLIKLGTTELEKLGLVAPGQVQLGFVVRVPKAYPVYDANYSTALQTIKEYLIAEWPEIFPVGRNGMHRYNNQDHSMLSAMLSIDNIVFDENNDIWEVNVEDEYHEEKGTGQPHGTGRSAPILPT